MATSSKVITYLILALALALRPGLLAVMKFNSWPLEESIGTVPILTSVELDSHYKGKHALLIGGTRGVGFGVAANLVQSGAHVTLVGRSAQSGQQACEKLMSTNNQRATCRYVEGDIGSVASTTRLLDQLAADPQKYDLLAVSAATFPDWSQPTLLQEDGLDSSWAIAVVGRFLVYRRMHEFLNADARVLNVMASGHLMPSAAIDRDVATGKRQVTSLMEGMFNFAIAHEVMQILLQDKDPNMVEVTRVSTHPGLLKTDLHRGQGLAFDIMEQVMVWLVGISEQEAGLRQVSILASDKLPRGKLSYVGQFRNGAKRSEGLQRQVDEHGEWLWNFLLEFETTAKRSSTTKATAEPATEEILEDSDVEPETEAQEGEPEPSDAKTTETQPTQSETEQQPAEGVDAESPEAEEESEPVAKEE